MIDVIVHFYTWHCHAKFLATLHEARSKQVKTTQSAGFQKKSCPYLPSKIPVWTMWGWLCWMLNSCCFREACKSTWISLLWWAGTLSRKQPDSKKMYLLWNEFQIHLWKVQCMILHWLFFCISQQTVMCLHISKLLCTCFMYITRLKTKIKWWIIVHWMCYVAFPFPKKKNPQIIKTPTHSCLASHIWDANYFHNFRKNFTFWSKWSVNMLQRLPALPIHSVFCKIKSSGTSGLRKIKEKSYMCHQKSISYYPEKLLSVNSFQKPYFCISLFTAKK